VCAHFHKFNFLRTTSDSLTVSNPHAYAHFFGKPLCAQTDIFVNVGYDLLWGVSAGVLEGICVGVVLLLKSPKAPPLPPTALLMRAHTHTWHRT
jgi:hypothetical protein